MTTVGATPVEFALRRTLLTATQRRRVPLYRWKLAYFPAKLFAASTRSEYRCDATLTSRSRGRTRTVTTLLVRALDFVVYVVLRNGLTVAV